MRGDWENIRRMADFALLSPAPSNRKGTDIMEVTLTLDEVHDLTLRALRACAVSEENARSVADSVVAAEADGIHSHGLMRLPTYCEHARCGKIDGNATPTAEQAGPSALKVDARDGFAHPAIDLGLPQLLALAGETGIAAMAVTNSYNCGVVGYHVERIADAGFLALGFVNAPASIAPWGGKKAVFGTNPFACAVPREDHAPLVIDQASSVVAKSEALALGREGKPIPEGWVLDRDGNPTTDAGDALKGGTMVPSGGRKGSNIALIVEILAACMTGANLSTNASSFADNLGGSPRTGQLFISMAPNAFAGADFQRQVEELLGSIEGQDDTHLPGSRRLQARERVARAGVSFSESLYEEIMKLAL